MPYQNDVMNFFVALLLLHRSLSTAIASGVQWKTLADYIACMVLSHTFLTLVKRNGALVVCKYLLPFRAMWRDVWHKLENCVLVMCKPSGTTTVAATSII